MLKPYVYVATGVSKDVRRNAPDGARVALHHPGLGRSIEVSMDAEGRWSVDSIPSPAHGGKSVGIARGKLAKNNAGAEEIRVYPNFDTITLET
jgi:hypothetical protein